MPNEEQPITRTDLREQLETIEIRIIAAIGQAQAATLEKTREYVRDAQIATLEKTQEYVRDAQTEILRGFHAFAVSHEARIAKIQTDVKTIDSATDARIGALEQRLMQIESKLLLNPPRPQ